MLGNKKITIEWQNKATVKKINVHWKIKETTNVFWNKWWWWIAYGYPKLNIDRAWQYIHSQYTHLRQVWWPKGLNLVQLYRRHANRQKNVCARRTDFKSVSQTHWFNIFNKVTNHSTSEQSVQSGPISRVFNEVIEHFLWRTHLTHNLLIKTEPLHKL